MNAMDELYTAYTLSISVESYIADPYWPEVERVVNIQKKSGMNRAQSDDKREEKLRLYLEQEGLSVKEYAALVVLSKRPWYRQDKDGVIIISRHQLSAALVQACKSAPAGAKINRESLRSLVRCEELLTDKQVADGTWRRYVKPTDGKGNPLSNQRSLRENEFIENFMASGRLRIDTATVKVDTLKKLLVYAGKHVGVGASRKMGYGRFIVNSLEPCEVSAPV